MAVSYTHLYMASLRKKIEKGNHTNERYIQTHIGIGYRMLRLRKEDENK